VYTIVVLLTWLGATQTPNVTTAKATATGIRTSDIPRTLSYAVVLSI
jgi:hypothetical protein